MRKDGLKARLKDIGLKFRKGLNVHAYMKGYETGGPIAAHSPVEIYCEVAQCCNISCIMCATAGYGWKGKPLMPYEYVDKISRFFPGALMMHAFGFGEPLMNKDLIRIVGAAKEKDLIVEFFTNAMLMNEKKARELVDTGVDSIIVSFDGATKETYEKIHKGAKFDKVVENLKALDFMKREAGTDKPRLSINFIAMNMNFGELPALVELAAGFGVRTIFVKTLVIYEGMADMHTEVRSYEPERDDPIIAEAQKAADAHGIEITFEIYKASRPRAAFAAAGPVPGAPVGGPSREQAICFQPWKTFYVKADGNVKPCCFYWDESYMGDLNNNTAEEIWNGPAYRKLRESINRGVYPEGCRHCYDFDLRPKMDSVKGSYKDIIEDDPLLERVKDLYKWLSKPKSR